MNYPIWNNSEDKLMMKLFLWLLDKFFQLIRKKPNPGYPYDKKTRQIKLPLHIEKEIREAVRKL
jgi:hypothetical protein